MVKVQVDEADRQGFLSETVFGGIKTGLTAATVAGVASLAAHKSGVAAYRQLTPALKFFGVVAAGTAGFVIGADSKARAYELAKYNVGAGTKLEKIAHETESLEAKLGIAEGEKPQSFSHLTTTDVVVEWCKEHRYGTVFGAWVASMAGSLGYISLTPLTFGQKLVQARMVAQGLTVAVLIASAAITSIPVDGVDEEKLKRERREEALYKWKKGSHHTHTEGESASANVVDEGDSTLVLPEMNSKH